MPRRTQQKRPPENSARFIREVAAETEQLISSLDLSTIAGLRNRAIFGLVGYLVGSLDTILHMRVSDFYRVRGGGWVRLVEDRAERHVMLPRRVDTYVEEYLAAAGIEDAPAGWLFRTVFPGRQQLSQARLGRPALLREYERVVGKIDKSKSRPSLTH